jgi:hypothetical protein
MGFRDSINAIGVLAFRALAYVHKGECRLISRNGNQFKSFPALAENLPAELLTRSAILDGEIVALDHRGKRNSKTYYSGVANHGSTPSICRRT